MNKRIYKYKSFWFIFLLLAYLIFGYFYPPKTIERQLITQLSEQLNMRASMTEVRFNPLTFETEIEDFTLTDANNQTWFKSKQTSINFDPLNLIWGEWKFSDLNLIQPEITLQTNQSGQVLIPALPESDDSNTNDELINFSIDHIHLSQGNMNLQAGNIKENFELNIKNIEIKQNKLILADEDTHFNIKITTENNEAMVFNGRYNHTKAYIDGDIKLIDWQTTTLNQVLPNDLNFNNQNGQIQAQGQINWLLSQKPQLEFPNIEIQALESNWQNDISIKNLYANIQQTKIDTEAQTISIEHIESKQGKWQINWPLSISSDNNINTKKNNQIVESFENRSPDWQIKINQVNISNWPIEFIDRGINASLPFTIQSLEMFQLNNLNHKFTLKSQLDLINQGKLHINSEQVLSPLVLTADINLKQLLLKQITPWIEAQSNLIITQGQLSTDQKLTFNEENFSLVGSLTILNANINDQNDQSIASWNELRVNSTSVSSLTNTITLDQITLDLASGKIPVSPDQSMTPSNSSSTAATPSDWTIKIGAINKP